MAYDTETGTDTEISAPGSGDDSEIISKIWCHLRAGRNHLSQWRNEAKESYDYFAGNQWSEDDAAKLNQQNRPVIVYNRIARTINAVSGLELQNRQEVSYLPREMNDAEKGEQYTAIAKWVRDNCDAEDEESEMFLDSLICGLGWTDTSVSYEDNPDGDIIIPRIDPLEMLYDPNSRRKNLSDARWIAHIKNNMSYDEFKENWPDVEPEYGSFWWDDDLGVHNADTAFLYENDQSQQSYQSKTVPIVRYQYWEKEPVFRVWDQLGRSDSFLPNVYNGTVIGLMSEKNILPEIQLQILAAYRTFSLESKDPLKVKDIIKILGWRVLKQQKKVFKECWLNGQSILEEKTLPTIGFSFNATTGFRDRNNNIWFGLVRLMRDPQMWYNKWLSQILHIINTNAKGGLLAEDGAFSDPTDVPDEWGKPDSIIKLNPGGLAKIQQREAPRYPDGLDRLMQMAQQNISDIPGVNLEMMGVANRDQAAYLEQKRKEAGITILATFFDALRRYRKQQGRILISYIREYISDNRLIRVLGAEDAAPIAILKDPTTIQYDVVVEDAPTSPNMKEKVFTVLSQLMPMLLSAGIPVPPEVLDYAPLPDSLIKNWKKLLKSNPNDTLERQQKAMELQLKKLELEGMQVGNQESQSRVVLNYAKAEKEKAVSIDEGAQAMKKFQQEGQQHDAKMSQMQNDERRKDLKLALDQRRDNFKLMLDQRDKAIKSLNN